MLKIILAMIFVSFIIIEVAPVGFAQINPSVIDTTEEQLTPEQGTIEFVSNEPPFVDYIPMLVGLAVMPGVPIVIMLIRRRCQ